MPEITASRHLTNAGWDDVPHLSEQTKAELLASTPPYLRDARSKGLPSLGAGAIYPIAESEISVPFFAIPPYWPRAYALDHGWNKVGVLWCAWDPETGVGYIYAEHYRGQAEPSVHASAVKARGEWIDGLADALQTSPKDGERMLDVYRAEGLNISLPDKSVDAGLYSTWALLSTGRLKVFSNLTNFFSEYRLYRRDEKGKIIKKFDHLMDCMRYIVMSGRAIAKVKPPKIGSMMGGAGAVGDLDVGY